MDQVQIFISYAREDQEKAREIYRRLAERGYKPWLDEEDLLPGQNFRLVIEKSLTGSDFVIICLSRTSVAKRSFFQREIKHALDKLEEMLPEDIFVIPARLDDCERNGQARCSIEDLDGGVKLEMVEIAGGEFLMGSNEYDSEKPPHRVNVKLFAMGKYQVTQAQWRAVAGYAKVKIDLNPSPSRFKGDNLPVERVSWEEAVEFCARLSQKTGRAYRLPTEAEWEYAARAGTTTPFAFGETITPEIVNYDGNYPYASAPKGEYRKKTVEVGSLGVANAFGLYDMHGNVWEWCSDWYSSSYYEECRKQGVVSDPQGTAAGSRRVDRGGGWSFDAVYCRSASRNYGAPGNRFDYLGFRLVRIGR